MAKSQAKIITLYGGEVKIHFYEESHMYYLEENGKKTRLSGVTTFCKMVSDAEPLIKWSVETTVEFLQNNKDLLMQDPDRILQLAKDESANQKNIAAEAGKTIHAWVENYINGGAVTMPDDPQVFRAVNSFLQWAEDEKIKFIASEKIVYSKKHRFVGTLDILATKNKKNYLLDIKTGNGVYPDHYLQTSAYASAHTEESGMEFEGRYILRLSKENEEQFMERMEKKMAKGKLKIMPEFKPFEAIYLDEPRQIENDFKTFIHCREAYEWKKNR